MLKCGKRSNDRIRPFDVNSFTKTVTERCVRFGGNSRARGGQRVGQMKLLSAGIIIGRYHQIYRKKSAGALSWTRLEIYRVRNYHETGVSATFGIAYIALGEHVTGHIEFE